MDDLLLLPRTRAEAKAVGASHYFTGVPCKYGHVDKRATGGGACAECMRQRQKLRLALDADYRELHRKQTREYKRRVLSDPARREAINERSREIWQESADRRAAKREADRVRNKKEETKARRRELQAVRYHEVLKHSDEYKRKQRESQRRIVRENRAKYNAKGAARRAARIRATPPWLTPLMRSNIETVYRAAAMKTASSGIQYDVDHIVPLRGELVCGLHVPWNLMVLRAEKNRAKGNRLTLDKTTKC